MGAGATRHGKYQRVRDIAEGGMGTVSLAVREEGAFRRVYAVKRLLPEYRRDERVRTMFMDEARIAGLLHHPNVVSVVDVGEDDEGPYLVMDYVHGVPLTSLIGAAEHKNEKLPIQVCVRIIKDIAEGLEAAHNLTTHDGDDLELVHRDVSPQNVLVGYDGVARLTDFGIAKALGRQGRTSTGILKGKFGYFAPERLQFKEPTRLSDVFSLGVVFFEALSGGRLYSEDNQEEVARRILEEPPPDIVHTRPDVHPLIVQLLFQMLAKNPERRPQSAREVARRLDGILLDLVAEQEAVFVSDYVTKRFEELYAEQMQELDELTAGGVLPVRSSRSPVARQRRTVSIALVALVVAGVVGTWSLLHEEQAPVETTHIVAQPPRVVPRPDPVAKLPPEEVVAEEQSQATAEREPASPARAGTKAPKNHTSTREPAESSPKRAQAADRLMGWEN